MINTCVTLFSWHLIKIKYDIRLGGQSGAFPSLEMKLFSSFSVILRESLSGLLSVWGTDNDFISMQKNIDWRTDGKYSRTWNCSVMVWPQGALLICANVYVGVCVLPPLALSAHTGWGLAVLSSVPGINDFNLSHRHTRCCPLFSFCHLKMWMASVGVQLCTDAIKCMVL